MGTLKKSHIKEIVKLSRILNVHWIMDALNNEINITCTRNDNCPRQKKCGGDNVSRVSWINEVKKEIIKLTN